MGLFHPLAPDGSVIDYGNRWAFGDGPPADSYSRITHPERFSQLQELAQDLVEYLVSHFDAAEEDSDGSDIALVDRPPGGALIKVIPADSACSPITFDLTTEGFACTTERWREATTPTLPFS